MLPASFVFHATKSLLISICCICLLTLAAHPQKASAQRITYQDLLGKTDKPQIYIDHVTFPSDKPGKVNLVTTFRMDYKLLRFKKRTSPASSNKALPSAPTFTSSVALNLELFTSGEQVEKGNLEEANIKSLTPVDRKFWKGTVQTDTYEKTQSSNQYLSGYLDVHIRPGYYKYLLQTDSESAVSKSITRTRNIQVKNPATTQHTAFYFLDSLKEEKKPKRAVLANFGENVHYGSDFHLLFNLPDTVGATYQIDIHNITIEKKDTTRKQDVFQKELTDNDILTSLYPSITPDSTKLALKFNYPGKRGTRYGLIHVPNSRFENGKYLIELRNRDSGQLLGRKMYESRWINMPISLLNIDVAIRMLRFIVSDKKIEQMEKGSREQRIQAFRNFWKEKDPTPETSYNELMSKYYQRIDDAYEKYSSLNQQGFNTDMGKIYIQRGPPNSVERKFPSGQRAVEVWIYRNKTYIFRATSGFGDFELVSEK